MIRLKARSLRRGQWFKVLETQERGLIDVAVRWVSTVKNERLELVLKRILSKLVFAMLSPLGVFLGRGRRAAFRLSELAVGWGNISALNWRFDDTFQLCLGAGVVGRSATEGSGQFLMSNP
jgi:hypothetical protein